MWVRSLLNSAFPFLAKLSDERPGKEWQSLAAILPGGGSIVSKLRIAVFGNALVPMILVGLLLGFFGYFGQMGFQHADRVKSEISVGQAGYDLVRASQALQSIQMGQTQPVSELRGALREASTELQIALETGRGLYPDQDIERLAKFERDVSNMREQVTRQSAQEVADSASALSQQLRSSSSEISILFDDMHRHARSIIEPMLSNIMTAFLVSFILAVIAGSASYFGARSTVENVADAIAEMTRAMKRLSGGELNVELPGRDRADEIGDMARALEVLRDASQELQDLTARRAHEAENRLALEQSNSKKMRDLRSEKSQLLEGMADGFEVSVGQLITSVSTATEQLQTTSQQMVELADGSSEQTDKARIAMHGSASNVTAAAAATDEFALSINEISHQAGSSAKLARSASDLVTTANTKMSDLSKAALEVGEIVELIQTIAERTNLLALNASIEAARGGAAGRGFAVVAREVKELAMQTSDATDLVTDKISAMQGFTQSSANDLADIVKCISELEQTAVMIASAVDQQSVSADELAQHIDIAASGATDVNSKLGLLSAASKETGEAAADVATAAAALSLHTEALRAKAKGFTVEVRRSARDLEIGDAEFEEELHKVD